MYNHIDNILAEWSYKLKNGIPDAKDEEHLRILENILFDIADYGTGLREGKKFNNIIAARITLGTSPAQTLLYNPILLKTIEPIGDSDIEAGQKGVDKQTRKLLVMVDNKPTILTFKILQPRSVKQYAIG